MIFSSSTEYAIRGLAELACKQREGPLAGLQGIYTQAQGEHRALVLLDLLGGRQSVMLPTYVLQPAGAARAA